MHWQAETVIMTRLFPLPIYSFLRIVIQNGGISWKGLRNLPAWLLKTILLEPLRWFELITKNHKIRNHVITNPPIFILGYYRSGTTYLQQLFMQDDRLGHTSILQTVFPEIMLSCEKWLTPGLEAISRFCKVKNPIHRIPLTWYAPGEEDISMVTSLSPFAAQWAYFFPKNMGEYFKKFVLFEGVPESTREKWVQSYHLTLKKISLANQKKQLVLKSPPNTARIKLILSLFPNAKFIFIHRNPYEVFASKKRVWNVIQKSFMLGSTSSVNYDDIVLNTYAGTMDRYLEEMHLIPQGHLIELRYENFIADPVTAMKHTYSSLELGDFNYCVKKMVEYTATQNKYERLNHQLSNEETKIISQRWERFFRMWEYEIR